MKVTRCRLASAALALLASPVLPVGGAEPLVVGMELEYPPFEFVGDDGEPDGVSVRMAEALGEYLRRPVEIQNVKFDSLITALKTGSIDLIISSMTATEERRESIEFSDPYVTTGIAMLVPKWPIKTAKTMRQPVRAFIGESVST